MELISLINEAFFNGILINKNNQSVGMDSGRSFKTEVKDFLAKLCDLCNYDTKKPVDAFEVGAKINLEESKTERIVNYSIGKKGFMNLIELSIGSTLGILLPQKNFATYM